MMESQLVEARVREAEEAFRQGRAAEALDALGGVLAADPDHRRALRAFGAVCHSRGLRDEAVRAFGRLLGLDPSDDEARRSLVVVHLAGEDAAAARPHVERLLAANQADPALWLLLGRVERSLGRPKAALEAFERSLLIKPDQPGVAETAARLRADLAAGRTAGAAPAKASPRRLDWLGPPDAEDRLDPLMAPLAEARLTVNRVVSLSRDAYFKAAASGDGPLWLEGCGPFTAQLLADGRPLAGRRVVLSLARDEVLLEIWRGLALERVDDLVVESLYLRDLLAARIKEAGLALKSGTRLHVAPRPAVVPERIPSGGAVVAAPGPHGPLSGLPEVLAAFRVLSEARPELRLEVGGPFLGRVWESAARHFLADPAMRAKTVVHSVRARPGSFLADKDLFLACPLAGEPPGLAEAAALGLGLLVRDAPGLGEVLPPERLWRGPAELLARLSEAEAAAGAADGSEPAAGAARADLPSPAAAPPDLARRRSPAAVAGRWLEILSAPAPGGAA